MLTAVSPLAAESSSHTQGPGALRPVSRECAPVLAFFVRPTLTRQPAVPAPAGVCASRVSPQTSVRGESEQRGRCLLLALFSSHRLMV